MDRRAFLACAAATPIATFLPQRAFAQSSTNRTRWKVTTSEAFDALAFLNPLSGEPLYQRYYANDAAEFAPRLASGTIESVKELWADAASAGFGLLGPGLSVIYSGGNRDESLPALIEATQHAEQALLPSYRASQYWEESNWSWFLRNLPVFERIFSAMAKAGFGSFRTERIGNIGARMDETARALRRYDVIGLQERVTGRQFDPEIEVVLLHFSKPHGIKVQRQRFLQAADYDTAVTVRNAAHEMLHPPIPMDGTAAASALRILRKDKLMMKIVTEHDPKWGYTSLEGLLNEDLCQALDQLISEELGVGRNPADRWRKSDDGMHVLAGALYGMLRQDRWIHRGGSIERWLAAAAATGRLQPEALHAAAAQVLERPVSALWPLAEATPS